MTARDWKPGAVAMVTVDGLERPAVRSSDGTKWIVEPEPSASRRVSESARPLVVIDPEDREQVEAFVKVVSRDTPRIVSGISQGDTEALNAVYVAHMQAALREFANPTPPKPEEPTGLGAVVEDAEGRRWVRTENVPCWYATGYGIEFWDQVAAVRVLSEGVQP